MSTVMPAGRAGEDIELGSLSESSASEVRTSRSHWHNKVLTDSKCFQSIKKIGVFVFCWGFGGGTVGAVIASGINQGFIPIPSCIVWGALGGFGLSSIMFGLKYYMDREGPITTLISAVAIDTIMGSVIAIPVGALFSFLNRPH